MHQYTQSSGDDFADNIRLGVVLRNMPKGSLREHLILNADRFRTWTALRDEIASVARAQATAQARPASMDLDAMMRDLQSHIHALGKDKGKGGGKSSSSTAAVPPKDKNLPKTPCPICGKMHWKKDCWYNPDNKGSKGGDKGKPDAKGKGKGKGDCYKCGKPGHLAKDRRNRNVKSFEDDANETPDMGCLYLSSFDGPIGNTESYYIGETRSSTTRVDLGVDSCAAVTVVPKTVCKDYPIQQDSKTGQQYTNVSGKKIADWGQRTLITDDDNPEPSEPG